MLAGPLAVLVAITVPPRRHIPDRVE